MAHTRGEVVTTTVRVLGRARALGPHVAVPLAEPALLASGEGIPGTPPSEAEGSGFATQGRDCRRATGEETGATAWSVGAYRSVASEFGLNEIALVACTAAVTSEIEDQVGEARAQFGRDQWDVVTFSMGGNDIRFAEVLKGCLDVNSRWGAFDLTPGCDISEADLKARVDGLRRSLMDVYDDVTDVVAPGGDVVVVGYPQLVEEVSRWDRWRRNVVGNCAGIQSYDVGMLRSVAGYLNQQIALAVQDADARNREQGIRFHFLDISADPYEYSDRSTDRHALCTNDPWLNGPTFGITSGDWRELDRSFHPHQIGYTNTARVLTTYIQDHITFDDAPTTSLQDELPSAIAIAFIDAAISGENLNSLIPTTGVDPYTGEQFEVDTSDLVTISEGLRFLAGDDYRLTAKDGEIVSDGPELGPGCAYIGDAHVECEIYYEADSGAVYVFFVYLVLGYDSYAVERLGYEIRVPPSN